MMNLRSAICLGLLMVLHSVAMGQTSPTLDRAIKQLQSADWIMQWDALEKLAASKSPKAIAPVRNVYTNPKANPWLRGRALVALAHLQGSATLEDALRDARSTSSGLRASAVEALGVIASPRGEAMITERLADQVVEVRREALVAYARINPRVAWRAIRAQLGDEDPMTVRYAVRALALVDLPEARQALFDLLGHENKQVHLQAITSLARRADVAAVKPLVAKATTTKDAEVRRSATAAVGSFGAAAVPNLLSIIESRQADQHTVALKLLSRHVDQVICDQLAKRLRRSSGMSEQSIAAAVQLLAEHDAARYVEVFERQLIATSPAVRVQAINALTRVEQVDHFRLYRRPLRDRDASVRAAALTSLAKATDTIPREGIVAYLGKTLNDEDSTVRSAALSLVLERLSAREAEQAVEALDPLLASADASLRTRAASVLERIGDDRILRRVAVAQGYLCDWMIIGSFAPYDMAQVFQPEKSVDYETALQGADDKTIRWQKVQVERHDGKVRLYELLPYPINKRVAYGTMELNAPAAQQVNLVVEADDAFILWLNGNQIGKTTKKGSEKFTVDLPAGRSRLLIKVGNEKDWWWYRIRISDSEGKRLDWIAQSQSQG